MLEQNSDPTPLVWPPCRTASPQEIALSLSCYEKNIFSHIQIYIYLVSPWLERCVDFESVTTNLVLLMKSRSEDYTTMSIAYIGNYYSCANLKRTSSIRSVHEVLFYRRLYTISIFFSNVSCFMHVRSICDCHVYLLRKLLTSDFVVPPGKVDWGFSKANRISRCLFIFWFDSDGLTCVKTFSSPISCSNFSVWSDIILIFGFMSVFFPYSAAALLDCCSSLVLSSSRSPLFCLFRLFSVFLCRDGIQPMMIPLIEGDIYLREESERRRK